MVHLFHTRVYKGFSAGISPRPQAVSTPIRRGVCGRTVTRSALPGCRTAPGAYHDDTPHRPDGGDHGDVNDRAATLAAAGLLTEQQARVYLLRDVEGLERRGAAEWLGVTPSAVDQHLAAAREKIEAARTTVDVAAEIHGTDVALYLDPGE
jgi:predicted DNA-binding protein (UPF0251 family)